MNICKPADYSNLFSELDKLMTAQPQQMGLYHKISRLVSGRVEKGAVVTASEHLQTTYPAAECFFLRNLRRMWAFYAVYEESPEIMRLTMNIGQTQNVAIQSCAAATRKNRHGTSEPCRALAGRKRNNWKPQILKRGCILLSTNRRFPAILRKNSLRRAKSMKKILFVCHGSILRSLEKACYINGFHRSDGAYYTTITPFVEEL